MTGRSKAHDIGIYLAAMVVVVVLGTVANAPLIGVVVGAVFFVLAVRVAWSSGDARTTGSRGVDAHH